MFLQPRFGHKFDGSYAAKISLTKHQSIKGIVQTKLVSTLVRGLHVAILAVAVHWVLFGPNYVGLEYTIKCDQKLRFMQYRHAIQDVDHRRKRIDQVVWITN